MIFCIASAASVLVKFFSNGDLIFDYLIFGKFKETRIHNAGKREPSPSFGHSVLLRLSCEGEHEDMQPFCNSAIKRLKSL